MGKKGRRIARAFSDDVSGRSRPTVPAEPGSDESEPGGALQRAMGYRPHLPDARRSRQSALVLVDDRQGRPDAGTPERPSLVAHSLVLEHHRIRVRCARHLRREQLRQGHAETARARRSRMRRED